MTSSLWKYFFCIIWDDLFISEVKLKLCLIFQNFQNGRHFELATKFFTGSYTGSWIYQKDSHEHFKFVSKIFSKTTARNMILCDWRSGLLLLVTKVLYFTCTWLKKYFMYLMPSRYFEYLSMCVKNIKKTNPKNLYLNQVLRKILDSDYFCN